MTKQPLPHMGQNPRLRQWSYIKHRKRPSGVYGPAPSPVPEKERRADWYVRRKARLASAGVVAVRVELPAAILADLRATARARGLTVSQVVAERLRHPVADGV